MRARAQAFVSSSTAGEKAVFLAVCDQPPSLLLAASADSGIHAGDRVKAAVAAAHGRGGGNAATRAGQRPGCRGARERGGFATLKLMLENTRRFEAGPDPFGRTWEVEFRWLQTGISIRHADTVDVKFLLWTEGEEKQEKVIALPHPHLLTLSAETGHALTDPWCMRLAARHLKYMIESGEDLEKTLVTLSLPALQRVAGDLQPA